MCEHEATSQEGLAPGLSATQLGLLCLSSVTSGILVNSSPPSGFFPVTSPPCMLRCRLDLHGILVSLRLPLLPRRLGTHTRVAEPIPFNSSCTFRWIFTCITRSHKYSVVYLVHYRRHALLFPLTAHSPLSPSSRSAPAFGPFGSISTLSLPTALRDVPAQRGEAW